MLGGLSVKPTVYATMPEIAASSIKEPKLGGALIGNHKSGRA